MENKDLDRYLTILLIKAICDGCIDDEDKEILQEYKNEYYKSI